MTTSDRSDDGASGLAARPGIDAPAASTLGLAADALACASVRRADFLARIDQCVRYLAARLSAGVGPQAPAASGVEAAELASAQLWRWLHADPAILDDGTPITFPVFDNALQRVGERLPRRGLPGQEHLLRAAWLLAEATHAPERAPIAGFMPAGARP